MADQLHIPYLQVTRTPLIDFPDVIIHATVTAVKKHQSYKEAKSGDNGIVQTNVVAHTGSDGFGRLARQPFFEGPVANGQEYILVDDFVGMGGTLANLRGYIEEQGGRVIAAVTLTGKPYSAKLALDKEQLQELRNRHGKELETWWQENFGHSFDCLTQSEARYLTRTKDVDTIRNRIAEAKQA